MKFSHLRLGGFNYFYRPVVSNLVISGGGPGLPLIPIKHPLTVEFTTVGVGGSVRPDYGAPALASDAPHIAEAFAPLLKAGSLMPGLYIKIFLNQCA